MHACRFALESPFKGCASRFTGPDSASSTKPVRGSTQCGVDRGRDRPAGIKVDVRWRNQGTYVSLEAPRPPSAFGPT